MKIGIMGAMAEEVSRLRGAIPGARVEVRGMREYASGRLRGRDVTLVFSRWGKVAAASTATTLIERFGAELLVFTGVAGALDPALAVGDIVVADTLVQHDMDASALAGLAPFEIPLLGLARFAVAEDRVRAAVRAAEAYVARDLPADVPPEARAAFGIANPRVVRGLVASGDRFVADADAVRSLRERLPGARCVEMEGAAVAQVAHEHGVPCVVVRTISDRADREAAPDFLRFVTSVAAHFTCGTVLHLLDEPDL